MILLISLSTLLVIYLPAPPPPHHLSYHIFTSNEALSKTRHFTSLYSLELVSLSPPNEPTPKNIYIYLYICGREKWQSEEPNICVGRAHRGGARTIEMSSVPKATTMPFCPARHQSAWANNVAWLNTMNVIMSPPGVVGNARERRLRGNWQAVKSGERKYVHTYDNSRRTDRVLAARQTSYN